MSFELGFVQRETDFNPFSDAKADVHSISSSSSSSSASKERKQPGRETAPARNHREKKPEKKVADPEPVSFDLRTNIKDFGKRPRKQKEDEEDSVSSEEVVEAPAKKRRQSAKSAPPKTKAKGKKGKDDVSLLDCFIVLRIVGC